jgi:hypothetical protein
MPAPSPLPHFSETTSIVSVRAECKSATRSRSPKTRLARFIEKTKKKHDGILVTDPPYVFFDFLHVRAAGRRRDTRSRARPTPRLSNQWSPRKRSRREPRASPGKSARALADLKVRSDARGEACGVRRCVIPRVPSANVEHNFSRSPKSVVPCALRGPTTAGERETRVRRPFLLGAQSLTVSLALLSSLDSQAPRARRAPPPPRCLSGGPSDFSGPARGRSSSARCWTITPRTSITR